MHGGGASSPGGEAERRAQRAARALFYVALPLLIICTSVRVLFSEQRLYTYAIDHYQAAAVTGISEPDLIAATRDMRAYFTNNEDYLRTVVHDQDGNVVPLFTMRETLHMHDVKEVVRFVYALQALSLCIVAAYVVGVVLWAHEESIAELARRTVRAVVATIVLLVLFGLTAAAGGFDNLFIKFHQLVFNNNYWQLDPTRDHLVQMFPEGFWLDATVLLCALIAALSLLLGGGAWLYLRRLRHAEQCRVASFAAQTPAGTASRDVSDPVHTG